MGALAPVLKQYPGGYASFWCPGCDEPHNVRVGGDGAWGYNGNDQSPTLTPSVLVTGGRSREFMRCHSFVKDGQIQFLSDCSHALAGQTVPIPRWPDHMGP